MLRKLKRLHESSDRDGHLFAAAVVGIGTLFSAIYGYQSPGLALTAICIPLWELVASPDMDHNSRKISGGIVQGLWVAYWKPYALLVPHRGRFSHSLLFGTSTRLLYFAPILLVCILAIDGLCPGLGQWLQGNWGFIAIAPFISDLTHLLKDHYHRHGGLTAILFGR